MAVEVETWGLVESVCSCVFRGEMFVLEPERMWKERGVLGGDGSKASHYGF